MCAGVFDGRGLSLPDLQFAVDALHAIRLAGDPPLSPDLKLAAGPELFEHPEPVAVWTLLRGVEIGNEAFQATEYGRLYSTDGWRLGTDPEAGQLLAGFGEVGLRHVWFTLCGLQETHDAAAGRPGAFAAIVTAMMRCRDAGIETGVSIILSRRNTNQVRELAQLTRSLGAERFVQLYPLPGLGDHPAAEDSLLTPEEVAGLPPRDLDADWGPQELWADPAAFTEGALTQAAMQIEAATPPQPPKRRLWLRVMADLELLAPEAVERGNALRVADLREDSPTEAYERLAGLPWPPDPPWDQELARRYGDTSSRILHSRWSLRRKWLDAWRIEKNVRWVPLDCYE
jgi:hypothetical protein